MVSTIKREAAHNGKHLRYLCEKCKFSYLWLKKHDFV